MKQLPQLSVWSLYLSHEQLSNCQSPSYSHISSTSCTSWLNNIAYFPPLQNFHFFLFFTELLVQLCHIYRLGNKYHTHLLWKTSECLDGHLRQHLVKTWRWPFLCCFAWGLSTVPKWAWFAAMCDWGTYWLTLMTLIGKVGSVSGSLTDWLACEECDRVALIYCLDRPIN